MLPTSLRYPIGFPPEIIDMTVYLTAKESTCSSPTCSTGEPLLKEGESP
jgi:hypothetical protein